MSEYDETDVKYIFQNKRIWVSGNTLPYITLIVVDFPYDITGWACQFNAVAKRDANFMLSGDADLTVEPQANGKYKLTMTYFLGRKLIEDTYEGQFTVSYFTNIITFPKGENLTFSIVRKI